MKWTSQGPVIDVVRIRQFEAATGVAVPPEVAQFYREVTNGGRPEPLLEVPVYGLEGEPLFSLNGLYGIDHPMSLYDLRGFIEDMPEWRVPDFFPLGWDGCNGQLMCHPNGPFKGQVRFMPLDEYFDEEWTTTYFVAESIRAFGSLLEELWRSQSAGDLPSSRL